MTPRLPARDQPYRVDGYTEIRGNHSGVLLIQKASLDPGNLWLSELARHDLAAQWMAPAFHLVRHVSLLGVGVQMLWAHARRVVAAVADERLIRWWLAESEDEGDAMGGNFLLTVTRVSVSLGRQAAMPQPASIGGGISMNQAPESLGDMLRLVVATASWRTEQCGPILHIATLDDERAIALGTRPINCRLTIVDAALVTTEAAPTFNLVGMGSELRAARGARQQNAVRLRAHRPSPVGGVTSPAVTAARGHFALNYSRRGTPQEIEEARRRVLARMGMAS